MRSFLLLLLVQHRFLFFNFYPAKIFPGFGALVISTTWRGINLIKRKIGKQQILVMGVPLVDFMFTIIREYSQKISPFHGDKKTSPHILLQLGYNQRQIALFLLGVNLWYIRYAFFSLESRSKLFAILMVIAITGGTFALFTFDYK